MGWFYPYCATKKSIIAELTKPEEVLIDKTGVVKLRKTTLKHCYRGNNFTGVLWVVYEMARLNKKDRIIVCFLMKCINKEWGYKPLEEPMGPYFYSCPLSYLRLVPVEDYPNTTCTEWRKGVYEYHNKRKSNAISETVSR
jgi:hypothetical protein